MDLSPCIASLCSSDVSASLGIPPSAIDLKLTNVTFTVAPGQRLLSVSGTTDIGYVQAVVKKVGTRWGFTTAIVPPAQFKFSSISPDLSVLDGLAFSDTALIVSTRDEQSFSFPTLPEPPPETAIEATVPPATGLRFDGGSYVDLGTNLQTNTYFTVEAWVKSDANNGGAIFQRGWGNGHIELSFNNWCRMIVYNGNRYDFQYGGIPVGAWAHVAAVYDASGRLRVYVNGTEVKSGPADWSLGQSSAPTYIGMRTGGDAGFQGEIADVRFWDMARSQDEIRANMHRRLQGDEAGLLGYWPLDEGQGDTARDLTGRSHGSLHGPTWPVGVTPSAAVALPEGELTVRKGLNFFSSMDMRGSGVDELTGIAELDVRAVIGARPADAVIEAAIEGAIVLSEGVVFGKMRLQLRPVPGNFSLAILGDLTAQIKGDSLRFIGGLAIEPRRAAMQVTMLGTWNEPFETKGVVVTDVALDLGVTFPPPVPTIGLAGKFKIGSFEGAVAVKFDAANPTKSMLAVAFNKLYVMDIIRTFCEQAVVDAIPSAVANKVLNIGMEDVDVYIVPQATMIGQLRFEEGIRAEAVLVFWGLRAWGKVEIDYSGGIEIHAAVDPIDLAGGLLELRGAGSDPKARMHLVVRRGTAPVIDISASVTILGVSAATIVKLSEAGFYFMIQARIFGAFNARVEASGPALGQAGDIRIRAELESDLGGYLRHEGTKVIHAAANEATAGIQAAQDDIAAAQREVDRLWRLVEDRRAAVRREREAAQQTLRTAERNVQNAQNQVNSLWSTIRSKERQRDSEARRQSCWTSRWWVPTPTWSNPGKGYYKSKRYCVAHPAGVANAARLSAEIAGHYAVLGTANAGLEVAKVALRVAQGAINLAPIDGDPQIVSLLAAYGGATAGLSVADRALETTEAAVGGLADVGTYLASHAGNILEIHRAAFEASLSASSGGSVRLSVDLTFMGNRINGKALDIDFNSPLAAAQSLGRSLLPG